MKQLDESGVVQVELNSEISCFHHNDPNSRSDLRPLQEQYLYIYDTLDEDLCCGKTWFSVTEIAHKFKQKSQKNPITRVNEYQREYTVSDNTLEL